MSDDRFCADGDHVWDNGRNSDGSPRMNAARHCSHCSMISLDYDDDPCFEEFLSSYRDCLIWQAVVVTSEDGDMVALDSLNYSADDLSPAALDSTYYDCADFYDSHAATWREAGWEDGQAGHDFCLTRNGHGTGFWDRGKGKVGDDLSEAAKVYGQSDVYIGDGGKVEVA